jgi:hypothetical protein
MVARLFDIHDGVVIPTEHCYTLSTLKIIMDAYPKDYLNVYAYIFYMTCPNPDLNPFFNMDEVNKEELIRREVGGNFSSEDDDIQDAIRFCEGLYQTPTYRAYMGIKVMLDNLADYMKNAPIESGRDGNITALVNAAAKFESIRQSFKGAYKDLMEEQSISKIRGGREIAYDS